MKRACLMLAPVLAVCLCVAPKAAFGWGENSQKAIAMMATQVLKEKYKEVFRPGDSNFERDVMRGAMAGAKEVTDFVPLNNDIETVQAVSSEIQLLRDVQKYGTTSYFAFRMGVLSALVSDVMLPLGFAWNPQEEKLQARVVGDIEKHLGSYSFAPGKMQRVAIRDAQHYFREHRAFYEGDKKIIAEDYSRGAGYDGFLKDGGPAYFMRAVEAVADAWHTILTRENVGVSGAASKRQLTWYFVKEINYLLSVKNNYIQGLKAYEHLESINSDITAAFESVGDLFYDFGKAKTNQEAVDRGVREWQKAYEMGGPERARTSGKLSNHYLSEGQFYLARADTDEAVDTDLPVALESFESALNYNRTSQQAAELIERTHVAIAARRERLQLAVGLIAQAESVREEADKAKLGGDYENALGKYKLATTVYEAIDDEFDDQYTAAQNGIRGATKSIADVIEEIFDRASNSIEEGDRLQQQNKYDDAVASYERVSGIITVIPADAKASQLQNRDDLLKQSANKVDEAKQAKMRYEAAKAQQEAAGGAAAAPKK